MCSSFTSNRQRIYCCFTPPTAAHRSTKKRTTANPPRTTTGRAPPVIRREPQPTPKISVNVPRLMRPFLAILKNSGGSFVNSARQYDAVPTSDTHGPIHQQQIKANQIVLSTSHKNIVGPPNTLFRKPQPSTDRHLLRNGPHRLCCGNKAWSIVRKIRLEKYPAPPSPVENRHLSSDHGQLARAHLFKRRTRQHGHIRKRSRSGAWTKKALLGLHSSQANINIRPSRRYRKSPLSRKSTSPRIENPSALRNATVFSGSHPT